MQDIVSALQAHGYTAIAIATFFVVLTTIAVALRFSSTLSTQGKFSWSEGLLLVAQLLYVAQYGAQMHGTDFSITTYTRPTS